MAQDPWDQKADTLSLGTIYAEMLAVLADEDWQTYNSNLILKIRDHNPTNRSYQDSAREAEVWLRGLSIITYGLESDPNDFYITAIVAHMRKIERPAAAICVNNIPFPAFYCDANGGSEPFEVADTPVN